MYLLKIQFFPHLTLNIFCLYNIMGCNIRALERNQISVKNEKEKLNLWEQICSLREDTFCSEEVSGVEFNCFLTMKNVQVYVYGVLIKGSVHFHLPAFTSLSYLPVFTSLSYSFVFKNWMLGIYGCRVHWVQLEDDSFFTDFKRRPIYCTGIRTSNVLQETNKVAKDSGWFENDSVDRSFSCF